MVAFSQAIETAFIAGRQLQAMFVLREAVSTLARVRMEPTDRAVFTRSKDPILQLIADAGTAARAFNEACAPLLAQLAVVQPAFEKLESFLRVNRIFLTRRRSMSDRLLMGLAIARVEETLGGHPRLEPKELVEFFKDMDLFDGNGPDAVGWTEILWKMRHHIGSDGRVLPHKIRGALLSAFERAAGIPMHHRR